MPKVSYPTSVVVGLVGPKGYPKGAPDGYLVNIPELFMKGYYLCGDASQVLDRLMDMPDWYCFWLRRKIHVTIQEGYSFLSERFFGTNTVKSYNTKVSRKATLGRS